MNADRKPGLGLVARLLLQHIMMILQILVRILKLQVNESAVLASLVRLHLLNEWCARRLHIFQTAEMGSITHAFVHSVVYMACSGVVCSMMSARM